MVQQLNRSSLTALRIGDATSELARIVNTPYDTEVGLDFETTGKNPREHKMVMVQLKPKGRKTVLIDARDEDIGALHTALLPLVTDARRTFTGQNLLFELSWLLSHMGFEVDDLRARFSDTMLRELVILGLGFGDAKKRGMAVNMHDIAERYGFHVSKEERSWFFDLDKRPEWYEPFPQEQLQYGRQDVAVVHLISEAQQKLIDQYGLQEVVDLEARVLPATAGMQHYGLRVDREKWLGIVDGINQRAEELAAQLHTYVDIPVMEHRRQLWVPKAQQYAEWVKRREETVDHAKEVWEQQAIEIGKTGKPKVRKDYEGPNWKDTKQATIDAFKRDNPEPTNPGALKDGVNLNSTDQMKVALRSRGHELESTAEEILTPLAAADPVIQLLLDYRDFQTARSKYGLSYLDEHAPNDTIYASIQQLGAETGRFSVREPNIQQIPARGAGALLRTAVVSREGYVFLDFDFSNVELRGTASITKDPNMRAAFKSGEDLHAKTAEVMFNLRENPNYMAAADKKEWTDTHNAVVGGRELNGTTYRSVAKTINFGLLYGMGAGRLASTLRISVDAARVLMRLYRQTYQVAVRWLREQGQKVENPDKDGRVYAATIAGRRRWFTLPVLQVDKNTTATEAQEALEKHSKRIAEIQRQLGNHPIQGTSADITKLAIALWQERYNSPEMRLVATVHDELLIEVLDNPETIALAQARLAEVMVEAFQHFLRGVDAGKIGGEPSYYWKH